MSNENVPQAPNTGASSQMPMPDPAHQNKPTSVMAILGLVFAFLAPLFGLIFSIIGLNQTKDNKQGGRGLAIAGLIISIIGMLIGLLWFIGFVLAVATTDSTDVSSSNSFTTEELISGADESLSQEVAPLGSSVRDGNFEFTVSNFQCGVPSVGETEFLTKDAQGQYCLVEVEVENIGNEPQYFFSSEQYVYNAAGQKYSADDTATTYANSDSSLWINEINPGNSVKGVIAFDLPEGTTPETMELHDSFLSEGAVVSLQ